jgi:PAS domain S-box-containing protein
MVTETPDPDPAQQQIAEADIESFRRALGPFVIAAETTRMPMVFTNAKVAGDPIVFANDSLLALTGYEREDLVGRSFNILIDDASGTPLEALSTSADETDPTIRFVRKNGDEFWGSLFVTPVRDREGVVIQYFVSIVNLTTYKLEQEHSRMLINELNHRVKNTLSTVESIVWQAFQHTSDPTEILDAIGARIAALSASHDLLSRENWTGATIRSVIAEALLPFGSADSEAERITLSGSDLRLNPRTVMLLGIALHELATNATKYGALSNEAGMVAVDWATETAPDGDRLVLLWRETGGPVVAPPSRRGYGSLVLERGLAHELGAKVDLSYPPDGAICTIELPVLANIVNRP